MYGVSTREPTRENTPPGEAMSRPHNEQISTPVMQKILHPARAGLTQHLPIVDVKRDVHAIIVGDLEEVARVVLRLR